jgi:hypothetical protein
MTLLPYGLSLDFYCSLPFMTSHWFSSTPQSPLHPTLYWLKVHVKKSQTHVTTRGSIKFKEILWALLRNIWRERKNSCLNASTYSITQEEECNVGFKCNLAYYDVRCNVVAKVCAWDLNNSWLFFLHGMYLKPFKSLHHDFLILIFVVINMCA